MIEEKTEVPNHLLIRRNLAEQSKWLNDPDPRPWVVHESQTIQWQMDWQRRLLAKCPVCDAIGTHTWNCPLNQK
jgi:hypothetical protein